MSLILKYFRRCSWCQRILAEGPYPIKSMITCHTCKNHTERKYNAPLGANGTVPSEYYWSQREYVPIHRWRRSVF